MRLHKQRISQKKHAMRARKLQIFERGEAGDNLGILLRGTKAEQLHRGMVLAAPGSLKAFRRFECTVYVLKKEEGGRHTSFASDYSPQFFFRTANITGRLMLDPKTPLVMPGDNVTMTVELMHPIPLHEGMKFSFREGGKTVGHGVVSKILPDEPEKKEKKDEKPAAPGAKSAAKPAAKPDAKAPAGAKPPAAKPAGAPAKPAAKPDAKPAAGKPPAKPAAPKPAAGKPPPIPAAKKA